MNLLDPETRTGKLLTAIAGRSAGAISRLEGLLFGNQGPRFPPIFIVGLPRGGTTLVYQAVCHCFRLAYVPMAANNLPFCVPLITWLVGRGSVPQRSDFSSNYGMVAGNSAPGEGTFWNLWFEKDRHFREMSEIGEAAARQVVRLVGRVERIHGLPFVNKNLRHANRLPVLAELFPGCVFIVVVRNPRDTALSILRGRLERLGSTDRWFSVKPRSFDRLKQLEPERQVVMQIKGLIDDMAEDMTRIGPTRFLAVAYEDFCRSPAEHLDRILRFFAAAGIPVEPGFPAPALFEMVTNRTDKLTSAQISAVDTHLGEVFTCHPFGGFSCGWSGYRADAQENDPGKR